MSLSGEGVLAKHTSKGEFDRPSRVLIFASFPSVPVPPLLKFLTPDDPESVQDKKTARPAALGPRSHGKLNQDLAFNPGSFAANSPLPQGI